MNKDFESIYENIKENGGDKFAKNSNEKLLRIIIVMIFNIFFSTILYKLVSFEIAGFCFVLISLMCFFILFKLQEKNIVDYKMNIVKKLVSLYNVNLKYNYKEAINKTEYLNSKFPEKFDKFASNNTISGIIKNNMELKMGQIVTNKQVKDSTYSENIETFKGIFGYVNLNKNLNVDILITPNSNLEKYNKNRIEIESEIFEKRFDCFSSNKILALQILTSDVIEKITDISNLLDSSLQIRIKNNKLYFRYNYKDYFLPEKFTNSIRKERLLKLYNCIDIGYNIADCIVDKIDLL